MLLCYLLIYFQAVSGFDAAQSGVRNIPLIASSCAFNIVSGLIISKTGESQELVIAGNLLVAVGSGFIYTLDAGSPAGQWVGYQVFIGLGLGLTVQVAVIICQSVVDAADLSAASPMALFFQLGLASVWLSIAQALFNDKLVENLTQEFGTGRAEELYAAGATTLRNFLAGEAVNVAVQDYMAGFKDAYAVSIALSGAAIIIVVAAMVIDRRKLGWSTQSAGVAQLTLSEVQSS